MHSRAFSQYSAGWFWPAHQALQSVSTSRGRFAAGDGLGPFLHRRPSTFRPCGTKEVWQKAKDDNYVIVTRDADFQELALVWAIPRRLFASEPSISPERPHRRY